MMHRSSVAAAFLAAVLLSPGLAQAQAKKGDSEILVQGFALSLFGGEIKTTSANAQFDIGKFVGRRFEMGFGPTLSLTTSQTAATPPILDSRGRVLVPGSDGESSTDAVVGGHAFAKVFLGSGKVYPFLGMDVAVRDLRAPEGGSIADNVSIGPSVGVKSYLTEKTALTVEAATTFGLRGNETKFLFLRVGLSHLF